VSDIQVFPDIHDKSITVKLALDGIQEAEYGQLKLTAAAFNTDKSHEVKTQEYPVFFSELKPEGEVIYKLGENAQLWDEFQPTLYKLDIILNLYERETITKTINFGLREIKVDGRNILINGRKSMMRGTVNCCEFPLTGYPSMELADWRKIMRQCRDYGLNHVRFHSWCPPEAAFVAADEVGIYLQPECDIWSRVPKKDSDIGAYVWAEWHRILKEYGNHPSFMLFGVGNEGKMNPPLMTELLDHSKAIDNRRIYTGFANGFQSENTDYNIERSLKNGGLKVIQSTRVRYQAGWPPLPSNSFFNTMRPNTNLDYNELIASCPKPVIQHESVQRCSYPDVDDIAKYTGSLKPGFLIIAKDQLIENGLLDQNDDFVRASGQWQIQFFKEEIEAVLRTKDYGGFQLLQLQDFPGQGTALVGVLDAFWDSKGYVTGKEFRSFCSPAVPLIRMPKRVFLNNERFSAQFNFANFGDKPLVSVVPEWSLGNQAGEIVRTGKLKAVDIPIGNGINLGEIDFDLVGLKVPAKYTLTARIPNTEAFNYWDMWVYPTELTVPEPEDIIVSKEFDEKTIKALQAGEKVLLLPSVGYVTGNIKPCFSLIYWNCPWTDGGEVDTLGMLCDPKHPIFEHFPTDFHTNWQWWDLMQKSKPMILDGLPKSYKPALQIIGDWNLNCRLGLIVEAKVGKGKLLVCSMDLENDLESRPVARQLKYSILKYMQSKQFDPSGELELTFDEISSCFNDDPKEH
jgi:hypothetical protein